MEENILEQCLEKLRTLPPIQAVEIQDTEIKIQDALADVIIDITTEKGKLQFVVEIKSIVKRPVPNRIYQMCNQLKYPFLLMAKYVNPSIAEDFKKCQLNFIDCQGNVFIHIPQQIYIDIQGNKYHVVKEKQVTAIFQQKGMQLLLLLLTNENLLNLSFREMARISGNSLGRISAIMTELKEKGYVLEYKSGKYCFSDKQKLFEKWIENYGERLRPKLLIGKYRISEKTGYQQIVDKLRGFHFAFHGTVAAEILTNYLQADSIDLFIPEIEVTQVIKNLQLAPANAYNIRLFNLFSENIIEDSHQFPIVLPMLIYAELLFYNNDRAQESAGIIYDKFIKKLLT